MNRATLSYSKPRLLRYQTARRTNTAWTPTKIQNPQGSFVPGMLAKLDP
jgi:hypothetical protein